MLLDLSRLLINSIKIRYKLLM